MLKFSSLRVTIKGKVDRKATRMKEKKAVYMIDGDDNVN